MMMMKMMMKKRQKKECAYCTASGTKTTTDDVGTFLD